MPKLGYYDRGTWDAQCDECGFGFKFTRLSLRWDNNWVCGSCWEPRQPQDFQRAVRDDPSVPIGRPRIGLPSASFFWSSSMLPIFNFYNSSGILMTWTSNAQ